MSYVFMKPAIITITSFSNSIKHAYTEEILCTVLATTLENSLVAFITLHAQQNSCRLLRYLRSHMVRNPLFGGFT